MERKIFFLCVFFLAFLSCKEKDKTNNIIKVINSESTQQVNASDLLKKIDLIVLETTDSSLIGIQIEKLEFFNNKIYILNRMHSHRNILCFSIDGKFLFKIDKIGHGPQEYSYLGNFFIDKLKQQIILHAENNQFFSFDLDGNFLNIVKADDEYFARQIIPVNDSIYLAYNDAKLAPQGYNILELDSKTFNIKNKSIINEPIMNTGFFPLAIFSENVLFYNTNDTIYKISDINNLSAKHYVDFGKIHRKHKRAIKYDSDDDLIKIIEAFNDGNISFVSSIFENSRWIIISVLKSGTINNPVFSFLLHDKKSNQTFNSENINFDMLNANKIHGMQILGCDGSKVFMLMEDDVIERNDIVNKMRQSNYIDEKQKTELNNRKSFDNPLLLILE